MLRDFMPGFTAQPDLNEHNRSFATSPHAVQLGLF